ncbi:PREDICTED: nucleolar and coiled-body phosphoprotein 1-like [Camelina sativa]|uniref:Nucleolar and coiled-body phosphoprotein 1-like n=1 Tax=Camelina sativa TaxID=90675 RepID=A0ABM0XAU7_CAMSA|nr:PREDICTED: nucleolar and coiled-body phosphoprotein 1-like [Camelina sativa]
MGSESKTSSLESDQKALLLRSVAQFLERSGFSKCFKKLLSEAEIEKKELNSTTLPDLEEIFSEFLNKKKDQEAAVNGITEANAVEGVEDVKKEKKKKKKKKETKVEVAEEEKVKETVAEVEEGLKEKKKKKKKSKSVEADDDDDDDKEKVSKKRKRSEPEETKEETEDDDEESKRRKKEEKVVEEDKGVQETPVKQTDIQENGNAEKTEAKSTNQKSGKGLSNSKEPKKPFQRVNADEVVFTDERLKDNSYYGLPNAKDGYGLKAQEILGQVRGRDFRHEKTKKKRGSYRGGQIDLQSHSIKFENSDEEKD